MPIVVMDSGLLASLGPGMTSVTFTLTLVTISVTFGESNLAHEGRLREVDLKAGARAVPAGGVTTRSRAASGISHPALGPGARCIAGLGQVKAGNARTNCVGSAPGMGIVTGSALIRVPESMA